MKELKLMINCNEKRVAVKGTVNEIPPLELVGIYEFLRNEHKGKKVGGIIIHMIFGKKGFLKRETIIPGLIPAEEIYENLKKSN